MDLKEISENNRKAWNQAMPYHQKNRNADLKKLFKDSKFLTLDERDIQIFNNIGIKDKTIAHICCNNGRELISAVRLGAKSGIGFDISDEAIKEAKILAEIAGVQCKFVQTDAYDIDKINSETFDIVYFTIGGLCWLRDLQPIFNSVAKMLKPLGILYILDTHPFADVVLFEGDEGYDAEHPMNPGSPYFRSKPWIGTEGLDYYGFESYKSNPSYDFSHPLSSIIMAIINAGIEIIDFQEYLSCLTPHLEKVEKFQILPLSYSLIGKKKE